MEEKTKKTRKTTGLSEGKKNIIANLINEYDIESVEDIQEALKDLLGGTIKAMMDEEMDQHLGYSPYERSENTNSRNGTKSKKLKSKYGEIPIEGPQDRDSSRA
jgi:transposase-like protein